MPSNFIIDGKALSVCFDLDGTLVDTAPDLIRVLNETTKKDGLKPVKVSHARHLIGHGSLALIKSAYLDSNVNLPEQYAKELQTTFLALYAESLAQISRPYLGVPEVLSKLRRGGARLSVCTNKPGPMARSLLEQLGISSFFDKIVGSGDIPSCKPAAQHIFAATGHRGARPIVMVGDGAPDVYAARAAKIPVIIMDYGYSPVSVHKFGADAVLRSFRELPPALKFVLKSSKN